MRELLLRHLASQIAKANRMQAELVARIDINKYRTQIPRSASVRIGNTNYSFSEIKPINPVLGYAFGWIAFAELQVLDSLHILIGGQSVLRPTPPPGVGPD